MAKILDYPELPVLRADESSLSTHSQYSTVAAVEGLPSHQLMVWTQQGLEETADNAERRATARNQGNKVKGIDYSWKEYNISLLTTDKLERAFDKIEKLEDCETGWAKFLEKLAEHLTDEIPVNAATTYKVSNPRPQ
ncbi:MAG: hypothetical protein Q9172_001328 [Xanthocarpia lactea]